MLGCWLGWRRVRAARWEIFLIALQTHRLLGLGKLCQSPLEALLLVTPLESQLQGASEVIRVACMEIRAN